MSTSAQLPIVAIVGRPNVGKSTLFNRYAGRRRVLVDNQPGITVDRIAQEIEVSDRRVLLVDTAGLDRDVADELGSAIQAQARSAVEQADAGDYSGASATMVAMRQQIVASPELAAMFDDELEELAEQQTELASGGMSGVTRKDMVFSSYSKSRGKGRYKT